MKKIKDMERIKKLKELRKIKIKEKHQKLIRFGAFLILLSFLCTAISVVIVAYDPWSYDGWLKALLLYTLGWALLLFGGFVAGKYGMRYIKKHFFKFKFYNSNVRKNKIKLNKGETI